MELTGKVIAALPERSGVSQRGEWKSQEFVIEYQEGQYARHLCFTVFGAERLQRFNIQTGQTVLVAFDIDAHEWNGRWFTDVRAFDVRLADSNVSPQPVSSPEVGKSSPVVDANPQAPFSMEEEAGQDNLPF